MMAKFKKELDLAGRKLTLETGFLAPQASSAVLARYGDTVVLATVCRDEASEDIDYFPLSVDYEEKLYAAGKISTSRFIKREGRPSEKAILTGRLIDRTIRPLFPNDYSDQVQVIVTVLSVDQENDPSSLSVIATSAALVISDIPWNGPVGAVRVGYKDGQYILNPKNGEAETSEMDLLVCGDAKKTVMIEASAKQISEEIIIGGVELAKKENERVCQFLLEIQKEIGNKKREYKIEELPKATEEKITSFIKKDILPHLTEPKIASDETWFERTKDEIFEEFAEEEEISKKHIVKLLEKEVKEYLRDLVVNKNKRPDGRGLTDIRPIDIEVGVLPRTHGSAIFKRGDTQILSIVTLGSPALEQLIEGMSGEDAKRFMHHYNFPPFSTGEVRRVGSPGRREIGHGALGEKALSAVIPDEQKFPYTIRVVSEVLSSAGSTSQGAICGASLALMDAGVPIEEPVAGIAMGLMEIGDKNVILTDIAYSEDSNGDMDFKIAGTKNGICAIQMDVKIDGIDDQILKTTLTRAKEGRLTILEEMSQVIPAPRKTLSPFAPKVMVAHIDPAKIGEVIGSGGRTINKIIAETGAAVDVEDDGTVTISGKDQESCQKAFDWIEGITKEFKPGEIYEGPVKRIFPFGAMVEVLPGREGLVHISQLSPQRVNRVEDIVNLGQKVKVRVTEIDEQGRLNLSMRFGEEPQLQGQSFGQNDFGNRDKFRRRR